MPSFYDENLLVGIQTSDDAAVYKINDEIAMIQTVDFFTPIVDDPYLFGQIAAANSLSDVYAMGGEPKVALNIVAFPNCLDAKVLGEIMRGGADKVKEAGAVLVGGHSVQDDEPKYGLCVSGFVHPDKILLNYGAKVGDVLILTKQIGSGVVGTALKAGLASKEACEEANIVMTSLNKIAKEVMDNFKVNACTDITGFGLLGHSIEMAESSNISFEIDVDNIAYIKDSLEYANMGLVPVGAYNNKSFYKDKIETTDIKEHIIDLLYDPQTSGGLLYSVPKDNLDSILEAFKKSSIQTKVSVIGRVIEKGDKFIYLK